MKKDEFLEKLKEELWDGEISIEDYNGIKECYEEIIQDED